MSPKQKSYMLLGRAYFSRMLLGGGGGPGDFGKHLGHQQIEAQVVYSLALSRPFINKMMFIHICPVFMLCCLYMLMCCYCWAIVCHLQCCMLVCCVDVALGWFTMCLLLLRCCLLHVRNVHLANHWVYLHAGVSF